MTKETIEMLRHIISARIFNAETEAEYIAWTSAKDIVEYALADNTECLEQFDYLPTEAEQEEAEHEMYSNEDCGFDHYLGCYTDDC